MLKLTGAALTANDLSFLHCQVTINSFGGYHFISLVLIVVDEINAEPDVAVFRHESPPEV